METAIHHPVRTVDSAAIPEMPFNLFVNGELKCNGFPEGLLRRMLVRKVADYIDDGWQVSTASATFVRLWRHTPAEMLELKLEPAE